MNPETTVSPLTREKGLDNWSVRNLVLRRQNFSRIRRLAKHIG
jgi:hypothetical protein